MRPVPKKAKDRKIAKIIGTDVAPMRHRLDAQWIDQELPEGRVVFDKKPPKEDRRGRGRND